MACRTASATRTKAALTTPDLLPHPPTHVRESLCINAGIKPIDVAATMGHRNVKTTLTAHAHLINTDDHAGDVAALGPWRPPAYGGNVIPLHG